MRDNSGTLIKIPFLFWQMHYENSRTLRTNMTAGTMTMSHNPVIRSAHILALCNIKIVQYHKQHQLSIWTYPLNSLTFSSFHLQMPWSSDCIPWVNLSCSSCQLLKRSSVAWNFLKTIFNRRFPIQISHPFLQGHSTLVAASSQLVFCPGLTPQGKVPPVYVHCMPDLIAASHSNLVVKYALDTSHLLPDLSCSIFCVHVLAQDVRNFSVHWSCYRYGAFSFPRTNWRCTVFTSICSNHLEIIEWQATLNFLLEVSPQRWDKAALQASKNWFCTIPISFFICRTSLLFSWISNFDKQTHKAFICQIFVDLFVYELIAMLQKSQHIQKRRDVEIRPFGRLKAATLPNHAIPLPSSAVKFPHNRTGVLLVTHLSYSHHQCRGRSPMPMMFDIFYLSTAWAAVWVWSCSIAWALSARLRQSSPGTFFDFLYTFPNKKMVEYRHCLYWQHMPGSAPCSILLQQQSRNQRLERKSIRKTNSTKRCPKYGTIDEDIKNYWNIQI